MSLFFLLTVFLTYANGRLTELRDDLLYDFKKDIKHRIDTFHYREDTDGTNSNQTMVATLVRLVFHDCGGIDGCNGCISPSNVEHSGLEYGALLPIEQVYQNTKTFYLPKNVNTRQKYKYTSNDLWNKNPSNLKWQNFMSRTDFWINAGLFALEYAVQISHESTANGEFFSFDQTIPELEDACIDKHGNGIDYNDITSEDARHVKCVDIKYQTGIYSHKTTYNNIFCVVWF